MGLYALILKWKLWNLEECLHTEHYYYLNILVNILNAPLLIQHTVKYIHWRAEDMILSYTYICKSCYKYGTYMYTVIIRCETDLTISINLFKVCYYYPVFLCSDVYIIKSIYSSIENCYFSWLKFFIERHQFKNKHN